MKSPIREKLINHLLPVYSKQLHSPVAEVTVQSIVDFCLPIILDAIQEGRDGAIKEMKKNTEEIFQKHKDSTVDKALTELFGAFSGDKYVKTPPLFTSSL